MLVFGGRKWKAATKFKAISPKEWDEIAPNAKKHIQVATALNSKKPLQVGRWWFHWSWIQLRLMEEILH